MKRNLMSELQQRSRSTFLKCRVPSGAAHSPAANGRSPQPGPPTTAPPAVWGAAALPSARAQPHVARPSDAIPNHAGQAPWPPSRSTGRSKPPDRLLAAYSRPRTTDVHFVAFDTSWLHEPTTGVH